MGVTGYRRMLAYVRPYKMRILVAMLFMIIVSSFRGAIAFLVKPALDDIFINKDTTRLAIIPVLVLVGVIVYRDWKLAVIALVAFPLAFYPIARFGRKLRRTSIRAQEVIGGLSSHLQETISGAKLVKSFGTEEYEVERFATRNANLFRLSMKVAKVQAMTSPDRKSTRLNSS